MRETASSTLSIYQRAPSEGEINKSFKHVLDTNLCYPRQFFRRFAGKAARPAGEEAHDLAGIDAGVPSDLSVRLNPH